MNRFLILAKIVKDNDDGRETPYRCIAEFDNELAAWRFLGQAEDLFKSLVDSGTQNDT